MVVSRGPSLRNVGSTQNKRLLLNNDRQENVYSCSDLNHKRRFSDSKLVEEKFDQICLPQIKLYDYLVKTIDIVVIYGTNRTK